MSVKVNSEDYVASPQEVSYTLNNEHPASNTQKRSSNASKRLLVVVLAILLVLCLLVAHLQIRILDL